MEVYGTTGARRSPGKVTQCCAGKYVTTAVMAAVQDPADVETVYKKAVQADAFNAEVLREFETFFAAYDQWGRGDAIKVRAPTSGLIAESMHMSTGRRGGGRGGRARARFSLLGGRGRGLVFS